MRIEQARRIQFQAPQSPLGRLLGLLVLFLVVIAAVFIFIFGAVVAGLGLLLAPVVRGWRSLTSRRRGGVSIERPVTSDTLGEESPPAVIDAEFTPVTNESPPESRDA